MVLALFSLLSFGLFPTSYLLLRKIQHFDIEYSVVLVCMQFLNGFYFYRIYSKWDIPLCEKLDSEELMLCYTMQGSIKRDSIWKQQFNLKVGERQGAGQLVFEVHGKVEVVSIYRDIRRFIHRFDGIFFCTTTKGFERETI